MSTTTVMRSFQFGGLGEVWVVDGAVDWRCLRFCAVRHVIGVSSER